MTSGCADVPQLADLESDASDRGLLLRIRLNRPLGLWALRLVVASRQSDGPPRLLGELKGWAYPAISGLQLDTMRVLPSAPSGVGDLILAATMAWALESTPCRRPGFWPFVTTTASTDDWCVTSGSAVSHRCGRWQQRRWISLCVWCGAVPEF